MLTAGGVYALVPNDDIPAMLTAVARVLGLMLMFTGIAITTGLVSQRRHRAWAPVAILVGVATLHARNDH